MLKIVRIMCVMLFVVLLCGIAFADEVYLKDGRVIRGKIVEVISGVSVEIEEKDGAIFIFPMDEVSTIKRVKEVEEPKPSTPAQPPAPPEPPKPQIEVEKNLPYQAKRVFKPTVYFKAIGGLQFAALDDWREGYSPDPGGTSFVLGGGIGYVLQKDLSLEGTIEYLKPKTVEVKNSILEEDVLSAYLYGLTVKKYLPQANLQKFNYYVAGTIGRLGITRKTTWSGITVEQKGSGTAFRGEFGIESNTFSVGVTYLLANVTAPEVEKVSGFYLVTVYKRVLDFSGLGITFAYKFKF